MKFRGDDWQNCEKCFATFSPYQKESQGCLPSIEEKFEAEKNGASEEVKDKKSIKWKQC